VKRFFIPPARAQPVADAPNPAQFRIAAIDFAHRQSRHLVLTDRGYSAARVAQPMLKDIT
jgi:hypothetical protein